jgi:hypothetical protein
MGGSSGDVARYAEAIIFDLNFLGFTSLWMLLSLLRLMSDDNSSLASLI